MTKGDSETETTKEKKPGLFSKIDSREDALKTSKDSAGAFLFVALIQAALAYFVSPIMLIDAGMYALLGAILWKWNSRTAAVLLLLLGSASLIMTVLNRIGITSEGGQNIILGLIVLWVAIRAVEATFKLHGRFSTAQDGNEEGT
jgi:hypothetical protein